MREPDTRWVGHFARRADLVSAVEGWAIGAAVPSPVVDVLGTARKLLVDSYCAFDYSLVAVSWALFALEASLKDCLSIQVSGMARLTYRALINEARSSGLITKDEAIALRTAAQLRNRIVHGYLQPKPPPYSYSPLDAMTMLGAIHEAVTDLYERTQALTL
jgi:Protein of unknown function DUF86